MGLKRKKEDVSLIGLDNTSLGTASSSIKLELQSAVDESFNMSLETSIVKSIMSPRKIDRELVKEWTHLTDLELADPEYFNPNRIDLLFGVDVEGIISLNGSKKGNIHQPIAQNSVFGWLVYGAIKSSNNSNIRIHKTAKSDPISNQLRKFWETEEIELKTILSEEHQRCAEYLIQNTTQLENGRIMTSIPFNTDPNSENFLGDSRKIALRRFFQIENKMDKNPSFKKRYHDDILSYINLNHMSLSKDALNAGYYLPHHAVVRESSATTKQRTVYDGSSKTTNGYSLNDRCLNGPTIQPDLFEIFIRWRTHRVCLVADIEKMYRQIAVKPEDRKYQKILWRFSKNEPIQTYELNRVTFGIKPAPCMAIFSLFFIADKFKERLPKASERIKKDFYVDDCSSGDDTIEGAKQLQKDLNYIFNSASIA